MDDSGQVYITLREITTDECFWLDKPVPQGTMVVLYTGPTFGVISDGVAVTIPGWGHAFTEIPWDAIQ